MGGRPGNLVAQVGRHPARTVAGRGGEPCRTLRPRAEPMSRDGAVDHRAGCVPGYGGPVQLQRPVSSSARGEPGVRCWCRPIRRVSWWRVGAADGELVFSFRRFDRAMGIAVGADRIAVAGKGQIWTLPDHSELAAEIAPAGRYDRCWLPRSSTVTGEIQCHEIAWGTTDSGEPDLWMVNTLFSCLAGLDSRYSFVPRWRPPFISRLAAQDRCHLNGLAMRDGSPAFVTVMARTDEPGGWRKARNDSGAVLDVASGETVTTGLAMPHSPRWHDGNLFVLNSGMGRLEQVDLATGQREAVAAVPGYARGLAFHQRSSPSSACRRSARQPSSVARRSRPTTTSSSVASAVIELSTGNTVATLQFATGVEEIFDVQIVSGSRCPTFGAASGDGDEVWLLPSQ